MPGSAPLWPGLARTTDDGSTASPTPAALRTASLATHSLVRSLAFRQRQLSELCRCGGEVIEAVEHLLGHALDVRAEGAPGRTRRRHDGAVAAGQAQRHPGHRGLAVVRAAATAAVPGNVERGGFPGRQSEPPGGQQAEQCM